MTTNLQISNELTKDTSFFGVLFYDELDRIKRIPVNKYLILNYVTKNESNSGKMGHFVVLDNRPGSKGSTIGWTGLYFFDSFGLMPDEARDIMQLPNTHNVERLLNRTNYLKWKYNTIDFQKLTVTIDHKTESDDLCGFYSLSYVVNPYFPDNMLLNERYKNNDDQLQKYLMKIGFVAKQ